MAIDYGMGFNEMLGEDPEVLRQRQAEAQIQQQMDTARAGGGQGQEQQDVGTPPKTVEELAQRQTGWGNFLENLGKDVNWQNVLLAGLKGAMAPTNRRASSGKQAFYRAAVGATEFMGLEAKDRKDAQAKQMEQERIARETAQQAEVNKRAEAQLQIQQSQEARNAEADPLRQETLGNQATRSAMELANAPEEQKLRMQALKAQIAASGRAPAEPRNPSQEALDTKVNAFIQAGVVPLGEGETVESPAYKQRVVAEVLKADRKGTDGVEIQRMQTLAGMYKAQLDNMRPGESPERTALLGKMKRLQDAMEQSVGIEAEVPAATATAVPGNAQPSVPTDKRQRPAGQEAGKTKADPVVVSSEAEAQALPKGTWVLLNGRRGQVL